MESGQKIYFFDKIILKYQTLSDKEKSTIDIFIKVAAVLISILLIYKVGRAVGEYFYNINIEI